MAGTYSGGCQCGAVRYRFALKPSGAHVCHCRMCQKAFGGFYAPLVSGPLETFEITRGAIAVFRSSDRTERGFCADCGTPLTLSDIGGTRVWVSIGSFDDPEMFPPVDQHGVEARLSYVNAVGTLPDRLATEAEDPETAAFIASTNHQHPDYDTATWPHPRQST